MTVIRTEALYLGRQFTSVMAQNGDDTDSRVIMYNNFSKFHARAWDDGGRGEDIWFEFILYSRIVNPLYPPGDRFIYTNEANVNSRDNSNLFYGKQFYKSGEVCTVNFALDALPAYDLLAFWFTVYALQWIAYDRTTDTPRETGVIEFTYVDESRLLKLSDLDPITFDRVTIFRPVPGTEDWVEVEAPLVPTSASFKEPFEGAARTLSLQFTDPAGMYLPQSEDSINYVGAAPPGVGDYSPVFRLGNRVAYEHSLSYGTIAFGVPVPVNLIPYTDQSRYLGRIWTLPGVNRKEPWVRQAIAVEYWDGAAWVLAHEGNEYDLFQYGVFFREVQTAVRASGLRHQCQWDYCGMFYMAAPTYKNTPSSTNMISLDCQDRLSKLDSNGRVFLSTTEVLAEAQLHARRDWSVGSGWAGPIFYYWSNDRIKTWQDPSLPDGLLLWFHDLNPPYAGNYAGVDPIVDGAAAIWNDEFEIFVEYYDVPSGTWKQLDEDAYQRTIYGLLINKDWSADLPWQWRHLRISYQIIIPDTNPVNEIFRAILEYPNYDAVTSQYGGPGLSSAVVFPHHPTPDYTIPGINGEPPDAWMVQDVNRFIRTHQMGSAFDAIKELMRVAQFPYNYRITSEPNTAQWTATPFNPYAQDIITFREVTQSVAADTDLMLMLDINIQQKIEEDRQATMVRSRVFDDFAQNKAHEEVNFARMLWGPGNSAGLGLEYEGGFNHNPNMAPTSSKVELRREKLPFYLAVAPEDANTGDISDSWRSGQPNNAARGILTGNDPFCHIRWWNDSKDWGMWPDFIATPVVEVGIGFGTGGINLAALDLRNGEWLDVANHSEWATTQHLGVKYGTADDRQFHFALTILAVDKNTISGIPPGTFADDELAINQATVEIVACPNWQDEGNTYPIIANNNALGHLTVEIRDGYFAPPLDTLYGQLGGVPPNDVVVDVIIRNYKWLPKFNRVLQDSQETASWESDGYTIPDVEFLEIWCIKPAATSMQKMVGSTMNDQFFDVGSIFAYSAGATIGEDVFMRIRDGIAEVPDQSMDLIDHADEFFREDLLDRMGIRTQVLPDDKALVSFEEAFYRTAQALYENLVVEDSYSIDGVYYPFVPRYSTILLNIASMGIAFPALLESREFSFAGTERRYRWVLRNYNNLIWSHPHS